MGAWSVCYTLEVSLRALGLFLLLLTQSVSADTLRCASKLVSVGDRAFEVLEKCGEPAQRELIGYGLGAYQRQEYVIEQWIYGPQNGSYRILTFEANRLTRIEFTRL